EGRGVAAQCHPLEGAEGITRCERARRRRDQRVHRNPATLVTPTVRYTALFHLMTGTSCRERCGRHRRPTENATMTRHDTGTRGQWLAARLELLEAEKDLTRRGDEVARRRQELPWVRVDKDYRFDTTAGPRAPAAH